VQIPLSVLEPARLFGAVLYLFCMKAHLLQLPIAPTRQLALAIVDQLPSREYSRFLSDIRARSRDRAMTSLRRLRSSMRAGGLTQRDLTQALEEVRAEKTKAHSHSRH